MSTTRVLGLAGLRAVLQRDFPKIRERVVSGTAQAAIKVGHAAAQNVPIAFGELRSSIHVDATKAEAGKVSVIADAPHAAAVEVGSRPHWVPLQPLVEWVKLRGMQGLRKGRLPGTTSRAHADRIAGRIRALETSGSVDVEAPMAIAKAIQFAIAKRGTRPHFFMRAQLGYSRSALDASIRQSLKRA